MYQKGHTLQLHKLIFSCSWKNLAKQKREPFSVLHPFAFEFFIFYLHFFCTLSKVPTYRVDKASWTSIQREIYLCCNIFWNYFSLFFSPSIPSFFSFWHTIKLMLWCLLTMCEPQLCIMYPILRKKMYIE